MPFFISLLNFFMRIQIVIGAQLHRISQLHLSLPIAFLVAIIDVPFKTGYLASRPSSLEQKLLKGL